MAAVLSTGTKEIVVNTSSPFDWPGSLSDTFTGMSVDVPWAQLGEQSLTACVAVPVAPVAVQLDQSMSWRWSALVAQPMKINVGRIRGTFPPGASGSQGGAPGSAVVVGAGGSVVFEDADVGGRSVDVVDGAADFGELPQAADARVNATNGAAATRDLAHRRARIDTPVTIDVARTIQAVISYADGGRRAHRGAHAGRPRGPGLRGRSLLAHEHRDGGAVMRCA